MKIGVSDPDQFTFSQQLIDHWRELGHEVRTSLYHEESFVVECDAIFYDFASNAVKELARFGTRPKRCVVRSIDIENYDNYHAEFNYNLIDAYIFLNDAHYRMLKEREFICPPEKVHIIPPGINTNRYTLKKQFNKEHVTFGFIGRLWIGKNVLGALDVVHAWHKLNPNVNLKIVGDRLDPGWWRKLVEYRISTETYPIERFNRVDDVNEFLENIDVLIQPSFKEAFSYVTAEALAKGIPVLIHDFYGAREIWPEYLIYRTPGEAVAKLNALDKTPEELRQIVLDKYDEKYMFEKIDKLMGVI